MGPSLTLFTKNFTLGGDLEYDEEDEYLKAIYDVLKHTFPGLENLIQDRELSTSGANLSLGFGMRYLIQIGYRF
jgi:hypothetical protein